VKDLGQEPGHQRGQASLELLITFIVAFSLVFGLFELCMFTYTCSILNDAVEEGVRYAIMHGTDSSQCSGPDAGCADQSPYANVQAVVNNAASASLHNLSGLTVTVTYSNATAAIGNPVSVAVAYNYVPILNFASLQYALRLSSQGQILF
jgi:Flp pilus assembly protein TadG